jgi:hypothetical protein
MLNILISDLVLLEYKINKKKKKMRFDNFSAVDEGFQPFDGGFSNAIGKTTYVKPSPTPPINAIPNCTGHTNSKACMSCAGSSVSGCPQSSGNYAVDWGVSEYAGQQCGCSYNPPLLGGTKPTSFTNTAVKFDGGFANIAGATYVDPNSITALTTAKQQGGLIDQNNTPYSAPPIIGGWNTSTLNKFVAFPSASKPNRKLVLSYQAHIPNIQAFGANQVLPNFTPLTNNADLAVRVGNRIVNFLNNSSSLVTTMTSLKNNLSSPTLTSQQYSYYLNNFYTALASFNELGRNVIVGGTPIKAPANLYRLYVYIKNN